MKKKITKPLKKHKQPSLRLNSIIMDRNKYIYLIIILVVAFIVFSPSLKNNFITTWDDHVYITKNTNIQLSMENIESSFFKGEQHGMYLPLTSLSFSINNYFSGLNPLPYHLVNIIIHLIIIVLVFWFIYMLFFSSEVAIITASIFALHTMQVESVAFAAGRRDILFTLFFLLSCIFYLKYLDTSKWKYYVFSLFIFFLSLLSKGQAASLPVTLIILDFFRKNKILSKKSILEKVPFFILSIIFLVIAYLVKSGTEYSIGWKILPFYERIILACYGLCIYLLKLMIPFNLSVIYPYPLNPDNSLPLVFYIFPVIIIVLFVIVFYLLKKGYKIFSLGILFFIVNIFLVLQIAPNSYGIINEHYVYLPSIGVFFVFANGYMWLINKKKYLKKIAFCFLMAYLLFLSIYSYSRSTMWKDSITIFSDVIKKYPDEKLSYNNRGNAYYDLKQYDEAFNDFSKVIMLGGDNAIAYNNRGSIYFDRKKYTEAINDYKSAINLKPDYLAAYYNIGNAYFKAQKNEEAVESYNMAIRLKPDYAEAYYNQGNVYSDMEKFDKAINDYNIALKLKPDYAEAYYNRGNVYSSLKKFDEAINDYNLSIKFNPTFIETYNNLGIVYIDLEKYSEAIKVYNNAIIVKPDFAKLYYNRGNTYSNLKQYDKAIEDFNKAINLKPDYALAYYNRGINNSKINKNADAIKDWEKAIQLSPEHEAMLRKLINNARKKIK